MSPRYRTRRVDAAKQTHEAMRINEPLWWSRVHSRPISQRSEAYERCVRPYIGLRSNRGNFRIVGYPGTCDMIITEGDNEPKLRAECGKLSRIHAPATSRDQHRRTSELWQTHRSARMDEHREYSRVHSLAISQQTPAHSTLYRTRRSIPMD